MPIFDPEGGGGAGGGGGRGLSRSVGSYSRTAAGN